MRKFNHMGIPTSTPQSGEMYNEYMKVYLTDYSKSNNLIEWLRFESDSWMPKLIQTQAHIAYEVTDIEVELNGAQVILEPTDCGGGNFIAFIEEEGVAVELMWNTNN